MRPVIFPLHGHDRLGGDLAGRLEGELGRMTLRHFPDGETYVRLDTVVGGRPVVLVCSMERPDDKILPLLFVAATAKELGASAVGLVAPYLPYMRQDQRFQPGEAVTSAAFARLVSSSVDWLVTVDPHLHRYGALVDLYSIPAVAVHAAPAIAAWIRANVASPVLIGPDGESAQWVEEVAAEADAPWVVLEKVRRGDRDVEVSVPQVDRWRDHTPVLVDDIISTAQTMIETTHHLQRLGLAPPVCIGVHGVFAGHAYAELQRAGAARIVTCATIPHPSNAIDVGDAIAAAVAMQLPRPTDA